MGKLVKDIDGNEIDYVAAVHMMDDELREQVCSEGVESEQDFIERYAELHLAQFCEPFAPYAGLAW